MYDVLFCSSYYYSLSICHSVYQLNLSLSASYSSLVSSFQKSHRKNRSIAIMGDSSASYIRLGAGSGCWYGGDVMMQVQHLIEKCILFHMTKEECVEALSKHANIKPVITSTVWKELEKENKEFFEAYTKSREGRMAEMETRQMIQKMLSDSSSQA
ncbi:PREDICTED: uncharacterized protein LOC104599268 isoform X1 [Nelumbo nucifera]|uniref:Uncharacterized protein n=2 Tax=Nelumbo nucifera TaxID=4432 RepID=A0A822Y9J3_NELNU|nr:PREDICTED: uncharacterized protein LOC104599268 isoform X1 [Nelumbo nucifera]DAD27826.1 TPA_asm: hypothetical protein HUJ06_029294 [Nelumbo nucifera]